MGDVQRRARRATALIVAAGAVALVAAPAATALDPGANSSAFGVSANLLNGVVNVPPTPTAVSPPNATNSVLNVNLGALGSVGAVDLTTNADSAAGTSDARASVADVGLLKVGALQLPSIAAQAVVATCSAAAPDAPTGATTLVAAQLGGKTALDLSPAPNTKLLNIKNLAVITLNEQIVNGDGSLTVNAIHIQLGKIGSNGIGNLGDVILSSVTCGPNAVTAPVDAFSFASLPVVMAGIGAVLFIAFGVRTGIRRLRAQA
ncbi:MAG TPA: hypothetical protein VJ831_13780 [Jatrophihabitantaceae bacterium]|nr:hypothetical protein [Jatrophihabitantaceae bacterium]